MFVEKSIQKREKLGMQNRVVETMEITTTSELNCLKLQYVW